ncbi:MAG: aminotransferase [Albidovulum sp.]|uniref:SIS domain-containing protein n=1 Tax=Albidovulum sp. TaxID=1872424 RepID=UPI001326CCF4|nr:aminotransferase [Defluviimonas sp.]KAB2882889.1 MAG: aminotransferase [Defluviimonas sp.]
MTSETPGGLAAIRREMARQRTDARASFRAAAPRAAEVAASLRRSGRLLLLGMGASHGLNRAVEPLYRGRGLDAVALPLSEQLDQPLPTAGRTILVASQSGESAEVVRWLGEARPDSDAFGLTLDGTSTLARSLPSLIGAGGVETAFAATRSTFVGLALHAAVLAALGADPSDFLAVLDAEDEPDLAAALHVLAGVTCVVTSGRRLQGLAETLALGLTELSRLPCFALECGQLRHGPMEMLGAGTGAVFLRGADTTGELVRGLAEAVAATGAPTLVLDASGGAPVAGAVTVRAGCHEGMAALAALLPLSQRLMIGFAGSRVPDVGSPVRSQKITRTE